MTYAFVPARGRFLPIRPMRAGMLSYFAALAAIEVGAGVVVAEAWRTQKDRLTASGAELAQLSEMLERLRIVEAVVVAGAVATTMLWSFIAVRNAALAGRNERSPSVAALTWAAAPLLVMVIGRFQLDNRWVQFSVVLLVAQAIIIYLPFGTVGSASARIGGPMAPFVRWYLTVALAFVVHEVFTGSLNLAANKPSDDLGRAAVLYLASALGVALMVVMAAEASQSMQQATADRVSRHLLARDDSLARFRAVVTAEHRVVRAAEYAGSTSYEPTVAVAVTRES